MRRSCVGTLLTIKLSVVAIVPGSFWAFSRRWPGFPLKNGCPIPAACFIEASGDAALAADPHHLFRCGASDYEKPDGVLVRCWRCPSMRGPIAETIGAASLATDPGQMGASALEPHEMAGHAVRDPAPGYRSVIPALGNSFVYSRTCPSSPRRSSLLGQCGECLLLPGGDFITTALIYLSSRWSPRDPWKTERAAEKIPDFRGFF